MTISADIPSPDESGKLLFEIFSNHLAILGKTGSGKTTAAKGFAGTGVRWNSNPDSGWREVLHNISYYVGIWIDKLNRVP